MVAYLISFVLFGTAALFYKLSITHGNKIFLFLHFIAFLGMASVLYPTFAKTSGLYVITLFPFFLPMMTTLRGYEIHKQKMREREMREI